MGTGGGLGLWESLQGRPEVAATTFGSMRVILKRDIVIKEGTVLEEAPARTERAVGWAEALIAMNADSTAHFDVFPRDSPELFIEAEEGKYDAVLMDWHVIRGGAPEAYQLFGIIYDDKKKRFPDGLDIATSLIQNQEPAEGKIIKTHNTRYLLGTSLSDKIGNTLKSPIQTSA